MPDAVREEFVNVVVILHETLGSGGGRRRAVKRVLRVLVLTDFSVLKKFDPKVELELVREQIERIQHRIKAASGAQRSVESWELLNELRGYSNSLGLSSAKGLDADDPDEALRLLAKMYLRLEWRLASTVHGKRHTVIL